MGRVLTDAGRPREGLPHLERGLSILERVTDDRPAIDGYRRAVAECYNLLGSCTPGRAAGTRRRDAWRGPGRRWRRSSSITPSSSPTGRIWPRTTSGRRSSIKAWDGPSRRWPDSRRPASCSGGRPPESAICIAWPARKPGSLALTPPRQGARQSDRAMAALRRAATHGYRVFDALRTDPRLDPIRARPDFPLFLLDLQFPDEPFAL